MPPLPPDNRSGLSPEFQVADALNVDEKLASRQRTAGFTAALVAPGGGVATGQSALVSLNGRPRREIIIANPIVLHVSLSSTGKRGYPSTLMGYVAHLRQAMIDARHYESLWGRARSRESCCRRPSRTGARCRRSSPTSPDEIGFGRP